MYLMIEEFDTEKFNEFIEKINSLQEKESLYIFIDSGGGNSQVKEYIKSILIRESLNREVIIEGGTLMSSALELFYELNKNDKISTFINPESYGMAHIQAWNTDYGAGGVGRGDYSRFKLDIMNNKRHDISFLTEEEKKRFNNGQDVFLSYERLCEIFKMPIDSE